MWWLYRFLPAVLALSLLATADGAAADPLDWKLHKYFDTWTSELRLATSQPGWDADCDWQGPAEGTYSTNVSSPDWTGWNCVENFLWAKSCKAGKQTVEFEKRIWLPGPALDLDASLISYGDRPLQMGIEINGGKALLTPGTVHKRDLRGKEGLFKIGWNTVTVHARKGKTAAECNRNGTEYAVYAQINAKFANDVHVTAPAGAIGSNGGALGRFTVTNQGPSLASTASVSFGAYTSNLQLVEANTNWAIVLQGRGIQAARCAYYYSAFTYQQQSYTGYSASCPLGKLKPGESVTITVAYKILFPEQGDFNYTYPISWGASGDLFDPKTGNNGGNRLQQACRGPKCKKL